MQSIYMIQFHFDCVLALFGFHVMKDDFPVTYNGINLNMLIVELP